MANTGSNSLDNGVEGDDGFEFNLVPFEIIQAVDDSWRTIRAIPDYEAVAGTILFKKIFELAPGAIGMYTFGPQFAPSGDDDQIKEDLYTSPLFLRHAKGVVQMLDAAINMLGPDMGPIEEALKGLGAKHVNFGVLPPHYAIVGEALLYTLGAALGDGWTPKVQKGWEAIYDFVSTKMMDGAEQYLLEKVNKSKQKNEQGVEHQDTASLASFSSSQTTMSVNEEDDTTRHGDPSESPSVDVESRAPVTPKPTSPKTRTRRYRTSNYYRKIEKMLDNIKSRKEQQEADAPKKRGIVGWMGRVRAMAAAQ